MNLESRHALHLNEPDLTESDLTDANLTESNLTGPNASRKPQLVIVGGGPVGATLKLALHRLGVEVTLLETRAAGAAHHDKRALALSYGSCQILQRLGVWSALEAKATPINTIHISQRGSLGRSRLRASDHQLPALGYVVAYGDLNVALDNSLQLAGASPAIYQAEATRISPAPDSAAVHYRIADAEYRIDADLAVLADGGRSLADIPGLHRETREYGHDALVSTVMCELSHDNVAYERFTPMGPIALLPNGPRDFSLVWTGQQQAIQDLLHLSDADFLVQLHRHFGDRVGRFLHVERRLSFPLKFSYLNPVTAGHLVVIGNAAQTMHPVAGQGFNVGLRDAWELAQQIANSPQAERGSASMLQRYQKGRLTDSKRNLLFTDFLVNVFSNDLPGLSDLRGMGLGLLDVVQPVKYHLIKKMSYGSNG